MTMGAGGLLPIYHTIVLFAWVYCPNTQAPSSAYDTAVVGGEGARGAPKECLLPSRLSGAATVYCIPDNLLEKEVGPVESQSD